MASLTFWVWMDPADTISVSLCLLESYAAYLRVHPSDDKHPRYRCLDPSCFAVHQPHEPYKPLCSAVSVSKPEKERAALVDLAIRPHCHPVVIWCFEARKRDTLESVEGYLALYHPQPSPFAFSVLRTRASFCATIALASLALVLDLSHAPISPHRPPRVYRVDLISLSIPDPCVRTTPRVLSARPHRSGSDFSRVLRSPQGAAVLHFRITFSLRAPPIQFGFPVPHLAPAPHRDLQHPFPPRSQTAAAASASPSRTTTL
ncbi:hypothetical protein B0H13DRAFT_2667105 [Mycena leptocephala]|nr:hypothetical protein B0H13DRAFT_2667105 [Mycena leptocephala]